VLESHDQTFFNTFRKFKNYPYKESTIDYLKYKTSLFLIDYFHQIFINLKQSKKIKKNEYYFATLNQKVKLKCLLAGYHTSKQLSDNICDYCNQIFKCLDKKEGIMLICGHAFHHKYFAEWNNRCDYCLEFYKKGVVSNVKSYIKRLEKDDNINNSLLDDEINNENEDENEDEDEEYEVIEEKILVEFKNALKLIKTW